MAAGLSGRRPFGAGLGSRHSQHWPIRSRLKLPTQSQMADGYLKVCVQNVKLFFTWTSEHFWTLENFWTLEIIFLFFQTKMFSWKFFSRNFSLLSGPLHCIKGICMYLLKLHCKNLEISLLSRPLHFIKVICTEKLSEKIWNSQQWPFQIFSNNFCQIDW